MNNPDDLMQVTISNNYECYGDHTYDTTIITQRRHLLALIGGRIEDIYADNADDWKPKPTATEVIDQAQAGGWRSKLEGEYSSDYYSVYVSQLTVWQPKELT